VRVLNRLARFDELQPYTMLIGQWSSVRPRSSGPLSA
jgi:hypothetical protein